MSQVDVLVVTALKEEYEAAKLVGKNGYAGNPGIETWEDRDQHALTPYTIGKYVMANGDYMSVALARPTRMGSTATGPIASSLVDRLEPRCLAMCGVCAGNPADVTLGDVVVAELAYKYDEGKQTEEDFEGDHRQIPLAEAWVRSAQDLSVADLPSYGEASEIEAKIWLLERLNAKENPRTHRARARYFPRDTWSEYLRSWEADGLLIRHDARLSLTPIGQSFIQRTLYDDVNGPKKLPFKIVVGPMASGDVVVKDGLTWGKLKQWGVRTVAGLEMEAAMIANIAHRLGVANWVVAKGVMDYADPRKDDRYKGFAARASAEVLFKLLASRIIPTKSPDDKGHALLARRVYVIGGVTGETSHPNFEKTELEQVCHQLGYAIAQAGAELVVCSPFPDSADVHTIIGYAGSGLGKAINLHSPDHANVTKAFSELLDMLGNNTGTRFIRWHYPGPEDDDAWPQAWLLSQLQALEQADIVVAIGGRVSNSANTLLHLAEMRRKPVLPFAFLEGASRRAFERRDWARSYPTFDYAALQDKAAIPKAIEIANQLIIARERGSRGYNWPPRTIFISRAKGDSRFAQALQQYLNGNGYRALLGDEQLSSDRVVESTIEEAILRSDLFVALWSTSYALSRFCFDELELALQRHDVGELQIWVFNLDSSDVIPRGARNFPQVIAQTPQALVTVVRELLLPIEDPKTI